MGKQRILGVVLALFISQSTAVLASDNPFNKGVNFNIDSSNAWQIKDKTATRSGAGKGDVYHLLYDRKQLRLSITDSAMSARNYQNFSVQDIQIDGRRLPIFQWCLSNQQGHSRFLGQGLKVKQDVCKNQGEKGSFSFKLNAATLDALRDGRTLSFKIKPFRSSMNVNFDISDFSTVVAQLSTPVKINKVVAPATESTANKCHANPPKSFAKIKSVEYACDDEAAKFEAELDMKENVEKERKHQVKITAERERKRKQAEAKKAEKLVKEAADKKAEEDQVLAEQTALAATEASQQVMSNDINNKMIGLCMKKWAKGEHRCYCEKFIDRAPAGIESDPSCSVN